MSVVVCLLFYLLIIRHVVVCTAIVAYSDQTFPVTICLCVSLSNGLWKNGKSDVDAVWHNRSDGSMDEAGSGVWGSVNGKG